MYKRQIHSLLAFSAALPPAELAFAEIAAALPLPPGSAAPRLLQTLRISVRAGAYASANRRRFGDVFTIRTAFVGDLAVTCHPDHARSLFTASSDLAPSLTGESQLRPVVGTTSVLTALGERHMRQRKLLLPSFHGDAIERRQIEIVEAEMGPPPVPYCWVVLGSQGRHGQGLSSDQDNAMILSDAYRPEQPEHAEYFAELARRIRDPNWRLFAEDGLLHAMNNQGHFSEADPFVLLDDDRQQRQSAGRRTARRGSQMGRAGADLISFEGNMATGTMTGPDFFREFVLQYEQAAIREIRASGAEVLYHNCGDCNAMLEAYNELGISALESLTPPPFGDCDVQRARSVLSPGIAA